MEEKTIKISGNPKRLKELVFGTGKAFVEVDTLDNDYTRTCSIGDIIIVEPSNPPISATRRYMLWYGDRIIYSKIKKPKKNTKWIILGIGEVNVSDIKFWCNAKKKTR